MPRLSPAEKQRRYRARRDSDPAKREEFLLKGRQRWKELREQGKVKVVADLTETEKSSKRSYWRQVKQESKLRKKHFDFHLQTCSVANKTNVVVGPADTELLKEKQCDARRDFSFVTLSSGAILQQYGWMSTSLQSTETTSPLSSSAGFSLDSEDSTEAGSKETNPQENIIKRHQLILRQMKQEEAESEPGKDQQTVHEISEESDMSADDTAQCSEELVIAKIEDFTTEMPIDEEHSGDDGGGMEMDEPQHTETQTCKDKQDVRKSSRMQAQAALKSKRKGLEPAVDLHVKIKDEPVDDDCRKASKTSMRNNKNKGRNKTPSELKIHAALSPGGNASSVGASAAATAEVPSVSGSTQTPFKTTGLVCSGCKKIILKGQTVYQRSGSPNVYCSLQCLCVTSAIVVKKKSCHHCQTEILDPKDVFFGPVDMSGTSNEFCSQKCIRAFNFTCSVCQKTGVTHSHEVKYMGSIHKLCSDSCFNKFRSSNNLTMNSCMNCGGYCKSTNGPCPTLLIDDNAVKFCTQNCLRAYKKRSLRRVTCKMCRTTRTVADMVNIVNSEGVKEFFCSNSCAMANNVQTSSDFAVECKNCKMNAIPQYHLALSDGTVQNFCSFSCVVCHQALLNKSKSKTPMSKSSPTLTASKPTPAKSISAVKTSLSIRPDRSLTRLTCAQCLLSFIHKPQLLEFKKKMYVFCGNTCVVEFEKSNQRRGHCQHCNVFKVVKVVKRINKVGRSFCGQKCKSLYEENLVKDWGVKHCRDCLYCNAASKNLVTGVFNNKEEQFCAKQCLSKYTSLVCQEMKCTMCKQAKKMAETVKWLGEMKHFCSLKCLMMFCSLKDTSKAANIQGVTRASAAVLKSTKETSTPHKANVMYLSNAANGKPDVLGSTDLDDCVPSITVEIPDDDSFPENKVSVQKRMVRTSAPPPRIKKSKASPHVSKCRNKATSCKPNNRDAETQSDELPKVMVLPVPVPVPVPVYVPVPMNLYTQYVPLSLGLPIALPVPLFFPTTLDSAERIVKTIQEIKEKIPDDPLEADLIMMAEMVAEDVEEEKLATPSDQAGNLMDDLDLQDLSSNLSWEEESVASTQTCDQPSELEKPPAKSATLTLTSNPKKEPQMDLEVDFPVGGTQQEQQVTDYAKQRPRRQRRDSLSKKKPASTKDRSLGQAKLPKLQHKYGVNAWKNWVRWRNNQFPEESSRHGSQNMTMKVDLLKCSTAELSYGLCKFISEVRRPNGEKYRPDSIFYLCLGIQQHLFKNERMENIFADVLYSKFCQEMTEMLKGWTATLVHSGYIHSRIEEEYLWDCKQLGAFSPGVLLNTLLYFFTKFYNYKTVEQHQRLSFGHFKRYCQGQGNNKVVYLRFYPQKDNTSIDGVPAKKRKKEDERGKVLRIKENSQNPFRCPVRLYEFYISKCPPSVKHNTNPFYLNPERSCVPSSPTWFSTSPLSTEVLENMLTRILTVRQLHMQEGQALPESDFDSDSD